MAIRLKDLKDNFKVIVNEKLNKDNLTSYNLYDPNENSGWTQVFRFIGNILFNSKKQIVIFNDNEYDHIDVLSVALYRWADSLPFRSDYYDPTYRVGIKEGYCIRDYMKRIGFEIKNGTLNSDTFVLKGSNPLFGDVYMNITVNIDDDATTGTITQNSNISGDYRWVEEKFTDLDSAIEKINSLVEGQLLCCCAWAINNAEKLSVSRGNLTGEMNKLNVNTYEICKAKTKDILIAKLENALAMLKNN